MYNIDETRFQIGVSKDQLVITKRKRASYFSILTNRESATAIEYISTSREVIPLLIILSRVMYITK